MCVGIWRDKEAFWSSHKQSCEANELISNNRILPWFMLVLGKYHVLPFYFCLAILIWFWQFINHTGNCNFKFSMRVNLVCTQILHISFAHNHSQNDNIWNLKLNARDVTIGNGLFLFLFLSILTNPPLFTSENPHCHLLWDHRRHHSLLYMFHSILLLFFVLRSWIYIHS